MHSLKMVEGEKCMNIRLPNLLTADYGRFSQPVLHLLRGYDKPESIPQFDIHSSFPVVLILSGRIKREKGLLNV